MTLQPSMACADGLVCHYLVRQNRIAFPLRQENLLDCIINLTVANLHLQIWLGILKSMADIEQIDIPGRMFLSDCDSRKPRFELIRKPRLPISSHSHTKTYQSQKGVLQDKLESNVQKKEIQ